MRFQDIQSQARVAQGSTPSSTSSSHCSPPSSQSSPPVTIPCSTSHNKLFITNLSHTVHLKGSIPYTPWQCHPIHKSPNEAIDILRSVTFTANSSELLAVVGPSGAGKSTLLRIISGRLKNAKLDSKSISFNSQPLLSTTQLRKLCGFVTQEDNLLPLLTVRETLLFSSWFSQTGMSRKEREERVHCLMEELGLVDVADSYIGDEETRGVSGGERRRVSIGVDVIHDPPILLLDEPTSGLDSTSALHVVALLASMARKRRQIMVLTIHQPGYRILEYISSFLLLSSGKVAHSGSLESLENTMTRVGLKIPVQLNALEFAMENTRRLEEDCNCKSLTSAEYSLRSSSSWHHKSVGEERQENGYHSEEMVLSRRPRSAEIASLSWRFWRVMYRTKQLFLARTMQALVGGFGLGSVYLNMRADKTGVTERLGLFAFTLSFLLSSTVEALPIFLQERHVLMREVSRSMYRLSSYVIANTIIFMPFLFVVAIIFAIPVYWIVGLSPTSGAFTFFTFVVWLVLLMAGSLVQFLSAVSPDFIFGNSLICMSLGIFFLFSGYFIPKESIPNYWLPMYYISPYRYPLDTLLINEYWGMKDSCFSWEAAGGGPSPKCSLTGWDVLRSRGLEKDTRWENVGIMLGFFLFYRVLSWVVLVWKASKTMY